MMNYSIDTKKANMIKSTPQWSCVLNTTKTCVQSLTLLLPSKRCTWIVFIHITYDKKKKKKTGLEKCSVGKALWC